MGTKLSEMRYGDVKASDVSFYLSSRQIGSKHIFNDTDFDYGKKTKMLIHGYLDNHKRNYLKNITKEFLKAGDFNVIQVDWGRVAQSFYYSAVYNVKLVGKQQHNFLSISQFRLADPRKVQSLTKKNSFIYYILYV